MEISKNENIRLTKDEILKIKSTILQFDPDAEIIIFGSRTDINKKGGDIDILVISDKIDYKKRRKIKVELLKLFGDRKIDLIITSNPLDNVFTELAYKYGVKL